jgi:hypothetical protein
VERSEPGRNEESDQGARGRLRSPPPARRLPACPFELAVSDISEATLSYQCCSSLPRCSRQPVADTFKHFNGRQMKWQNLSRSMMRRGEFRRRWLIGPYYPRVGLPICDYSGEEILNARNIGGIVVLLIVVYLILHFLFHVI